MTIVDAIRSLTDGKAARPPSFSGGYVSKTVIPRNDSDTWDEKFTLSFVKHSGGEETPVSYDFTVERTGQDYSVTVPDGGMPLDPQLFAAIFLKYDWFTGSVADFERSRTGQEW